jgi:IS30 family transposase
MMRNGFSYVIGFFHSLFSAIQSVHFGYLLGSLMLSFDKAKKLNSVIFTKEKSGMLSTKTEQLEWRRSKVVEMRARGLSYAEIAKQLQVSRASIGSDVQYLREQAKGTIKEYVTEHLPEQYQVCLSALDTILKMHMRYLRQQMITEKSCRQWSYSRIPIWLS